MDAARFVEIRALFETARELDVSERLACLQASGASAEVIDEVMALLDAGENHSTERFARPLRAALADDSLQLQPGDQLGVWRIEREIAQGGMGSVYEVRRADGHFAQTAALKFIKGRQGLSAQTHFARERQLLASLTHPQIARLLDGGANAQGYPYLVMEFVAGLAIDRYCASERLSMAALLELFVSACNAVAFAHRQLIVHCDIKPSNLLVTAEGRPILLDFGIAQLLGANDDAPPSDSATAQMIAYTPRYASPEQRRGERLGTTSDIFSLGVLLHELLSLVSTHALNAELDAICAKASHVDPLQRYATVDALCADIERFRKRQPVQALPATASYWLRKLLLRRWPALLMAAGFLLTVLSFTAWVMVESARALAAEKIALAARDRALQAEAEARASEASALQVSEFLTSVFGGANPDAQTGTVVTSVLIDAALQRVERDLADQPATQAQMYAALGAVQYTIEQIEVGRESYRRAIALERTQKRPLVLAQMLIASAMWRLQHFDGTEAIADAREGLSLVETYSAPDSMLRLDALNTFASLVGGSGDMNEATKLFEQAIELARRLAPNTERLSEVLGATAWHQRTLRNYDASIELMRERLALDEHLNGDTQAEHLQMLEALAGTLGLANRYAEAEEIFQRVIQQRRADGSLESRFGAWALAEYARMLGNAGRPLEALPLFTEALAIGDRKLADDGAARAVWTGNFAAAADQAGLSALAIEKYATATAMAEKLWGPTGRGMGTMQLRYGRVLLESGRATAAREWLERGRAAFIDAGKADDPDLMAARIEYARWLIATGRLDSARQELTEIDAHQAQLSAALAARALHTSALLQVAAGEIDPGLSALAQAELALRDAYGAHDARGWLIAIYRAELLLRLGRKVQARELATLILAKVTGKLHPSSPILQRLRALASANLSATASLDRHTG